MAFSDVRPVLTIGHSTHSFEQFMEILKKSGAQLLVDVRARPWNPFLPSFDKERMKMDLYDQGIIYFFMGHVLGLRPVDDSFFDDDGTIDYIAYEKSLSFQKGIEWIIDRSREGQVCLMAGLASPWECHRHWLIGQSLMSRGVSLIHLMDDGSREIATPDLFHYTESLINHGKLNDDDSVVN